MIISQSFPLINVANQQLKENVLKHVYSVRVSYFVLWEGLGRYVEIVESALTHCFRAASKSGLLNLCKVLNVMFSDCMLGGEQRRSSNGGVDVVRALLVPVYFT